jgi:hypothetical protein
MAFGLMATIVTREHDAKQDTQQNLDFSSAEEAIFAFEATKELFRTHVQRRESEFKIAYE